MCSITLLQNHQNNPYIVHKQAGSWWEHTLLYHKLLSSVWHDVLCQAALWLSCHSLIPFDQHVSVPLIALRYSDSQVNHHDTAGTHAGSSIHVMKFSIDMCSNCSPSQCWWNNMLLTAILSQWTVGTLKVCMQWTCIYSYIGKDRYYSLLHILCCTVFGTDVCNLSSLFPIRSTASSWWHESPYFVLTYLKGREISV
jgi:hypothetical protein